MATEDKKTIHKNENSETTVEFDGEIVVITQITKGYEPNEIRMYLDEFEEGYEFIKQRIDYTE